MIRLNRDEIKTEDHIAFIENLVRASTVDIVRSDEVQGLIDKSILNNVAEHEEMIDLASSILAHISSPRTVARVKPGNGPDSFVDRKPNNLLLSPDNTKHCYIPIGSNLTFECKELLQKIGLMDKSLLINMSISLSLFTTMIYLKPITISLRPILTMI